MYITALVILYIFMISEKRKSVFGICQYIMHYKWTLLLYINISSGVFQFPVQEQPGGDSSFQSPAHSTFGQSSPANDFHQQHPHNNRSNHSHHNNHNELNADSEATPSFPSMHQEMVLVPEQVTDSMANSTVDSSTLPQVGLSLVVNFQRITYMLTQLYLISSYMSPVSNCFVVVVFAFKDQLK